MIRSISLLFFISIFLHQTSSEAESSYSYVERVKKNHPAKRAVQILSKRLAFETNKQKMNLDMAAVCLVAMKELDSTAYQTELSKTAALLKKALKDPVSAQMQTENILNFISRISSQSSIEDGYFLIEQLGTSHLNEASRLFSDILVQMKPELYMKFFDSKLDIINSQPEKYKTLIEFFCVAAVLTGQTQKCADKIAHLINTQQVEPWLSSLELIVKINLLDFESATKILKKFDPNCASNPNQPWINFHIARLYRIEKTIEKSLICLETFKSDIKDDSEALQFYHLEHGKTLRFVDLLKSDAAFEAADTFNQTTKNPFSYFEYIVEIEKTKNFALKKDVLNTKKHLTRLKTKYKSGELKPYIELIQWIEAYSTGEARTETKNLRNLEIYDFSVFVDSLNDKTKKTN